MVQNRFNERFGRGPRIENGGADLEMRPPKIPLANDSGNWLSLQSPCHKRFESWGALADRTVRIPYEFRMIDSKRRAEQNARIGVGPLYAGSRKAQRDS